MGDPNFVSMNEEDNPPLHQVFPEHYEDPPVMMEDFRKDRWLDAVRVLQPGDLRLNDGERVYCEKP